METKIPKRKNQKRMSNTDLDKQIKQKLEEALKKYFEEKSSFKSFSLCMKESALWLKEQGK